MKDDDELRWQDYAARELGDRPVSELSVVTKEGLLVKPSYFEGDLPNSAKGAVPGEAPFTRGPYATMYAGKPWTIRQYAGFSSAHESNAFYRSCLAQGQRGLSVAFDLPTHRGYDSDHPRVFGDVGKAGVAIDSVEDMVLLFRGIPLDQVSVSMTMSGAVLPVLAAFIVAAEEQGVPREKLRGTIQNDILKEFMVRNTYIYPPKPSMRIAADVIEYASRNMPRYNGISISGYHLHEAGAPADMELAFTLANGIEYVKAALSRGLTIDEFAPRLSFFFAVGMDFFVEIAKLRAARLLWAKLIGERFSPKSPASSRLRMHCQTSGVSLTAQDPYNNVTRTAIEGLAALFGGTQSLHTNAFDEALALPSKTSARVARNTQLIMQHEAAVGRTVDPLGGSYYVERLTAEMAEKALRRVEQIEAQGGMLSAIEHGVAQRSIAEAAMRRQARLDQGQDVVVGVNAFVAEFASRPALFAQDGVSVRESQLERLQQLKAARAARGVGEALTALRRAAESASGNLLEPTILAMKKRATLGEVSECLADVFGRHRADVVGVYGVYGGERSEDEDFRALRSKLQGFAQAMGRQPRILLAKLGQDGHDRGLKVIAGGLSDVGFDVDLGPLFQTPEEVAATAIDHDVHLVGISTQAGAHLALLPQLRAELTRLGGEGILLVAGGIIPEADHAELRLAGIADLFQPGDTVVSIAERVLALLSRSESVPRNGE